MAATSLSDSKKMLELEACTDDDKRDALRKALESQTFARSEQLKSFLRYVCEADFRGVSSRLTEYVIGVEVLHRPDSYSPSEDSSVRTRAYDLRQKLEKLYAGELLNESVQIVIPKGAYAPQFVRVAPPAQAFSEGPADASPSSERRPGKFGGSWARLAAFILCAALAGAAAAFLIGGHSLARNQLDRVVFEAWEPFAKPESTALLIAATPLYLVLGPETHAAFNTQIYPAPPEAYPLFRQHRPLAPDARLGMIFTKDALGVGAMNAVLLASNTIRAMGAASPQLLPERPAMMPMLHGRDAILFGAPVDSQVITEILDRAPLSVVYDQKLREFVVADRGTGQVFAPEKEPNGDFHSVHGLITVLNTRESERGRLGMIVFSGVTSVGTHGAAEFFTSRASLKALKDLFAKEGVHGFPPAYQVVVKCRIENMLLVGTEYQSHRILKRE